MVSTDRPVSLVADGATFAYPGNVPTLQAFTLSLPIHDTATLMGPSGCGKSTLLRLLAGLEHCSSGSVGFQLLGEGKASRDLFYALQDFDSFPWLSVQRNVEVIIEHSSRAMPTTAKEIMSRVGLAEHANKYPRELSGGLRKRLALARAVASGAGIWLLDEVFSSLDIRARVSLYGELERARQNSDAAVLHVTHDVEEAVFLSSQVVVLGGPPLHVREIVSIDADAGMRTTNFAESPVFLKAVGKITSLLLS